MKLSIAPMIDWTNTHFRVFMRMLAPKALLYTEMLTTQAVLYNPHRSLDYNAFEHPLAIQLGGSDPSQLAKSAKLAQDQGFIEINLNLGCPSDRVQKGRFGACLMQEAELVAQCIDAIKNAVSIPVTAKTRLGIDNFDSYDFFQDFVHSLVQVGCEKIIVHARKAWLKGLSPKENRTIPPINYNYVYKIKEEIDIPVIINGNIQSIDEVNAHLNIIDGVMLGRLSYQNPYAIAQIHHELYPEIALKTREEIYTQYVNYLKPKIKSGVKPNVLLKPLLNLYHSTPNSKKFKLRLLNLDF